MSCVYRSAHSKVLSSFYDWFKLYLIVGVSHVSYIEQTFTKERRVQVTFRVQFIKFFHLNFITILPYPPRVQIG